MAVANPRTRSLTPGFQGIQSALSQQARIAGASPPSGLGTATAISGAVKNIASDQRKQKSSEALIRLRALLEADAEEARRKFDSRHEIKITDAEIKKIANGFGIPPEDLPGLKGRSFKDVESFEKFFTKKVVMALGLEKAELEQREPGAVEGEQETASIPTPGPVFETLEKAGTAGAEEIGVRGSKTNQQKIDALQSKIDALNIQTTGSKDKRRFQMVPVESPIDGKTRLTRFDTAGEFAFKPSQDDPLAGKGEKLITDPRSNEKAIVSRARKVSPITGPGQGSTPGEPLTNIRQFTAKQEDLLPKLEERLEKTDSFKDARKLKSTVGQFKQLLSLDLATATGLLKSLAAKSLGKEAGALAEGDVQRVTGSQALDQKFFRMVRTAFNDTLTEQTFSEFNQIADAILQRASLLEDLAVSDIVNDATGPLGKFQNVDKNALRERIGAPDATGLVNSEIVQFSIESFNQALANLNKSDIPVDQESILRMLSFMEKKGLATRRRKKR